uniref:G-protein coupled receptors family 1 profile domain-containing protein n=1 Tax=Catharus ustulatus TaxID=91951 RepID=A0A8C3TXR0_CATUS
MSWLVLSPSAAVCVTLLLSCAWLGSAAQPSSAQGKGRVPCSALTPQEKNVCSEASEEDFLNSTLSTRLLPALYSVVLLVGLPANALACWVLATNFRRCSSTTFLLNLAMADLLFVLLLPFKISYHLLGNHWLFGDYLCRTMVAFFYGNMYSSILFLTCIGLERYISVAHPFLWKGSSWERGKVGISVGIWLVVGLGMSPLLLRSHTHDISSLNITTCHDVLGKETQGSWLLFPVPGGAGLWPALRAHDHLLQLHPGEAAGQGRELRARGACPGPGLPGLHRLLHAQQRSALHPLPAGAHGLQQQHLHLLCPGPGAQRLQQLLRSLHLLLRLAGFPGLAPGCRGSLPAGARGLVGEIHGENTPASEV